MIQHTDHSPFLVLCRYSWGVYLDYYNSNVYPGELTNLTWIGSLWFGLTNVTGPFHVYLCKKIGYKWMLGLSCFLSCVAMMMASLSSSIWQVCLTQGVISGIGSSLAWFPCISAPQQWFSSKRGLAVGLAYTGSGLGGLALSNIIRASIDSVGLQYSLRILGFIQLVLLAISFLTVKPLNPITRNVPFIDISPFGSSKFWTLCSIHFICNFSFYIPSSFVPSYATTLNIPKSTSANMSAVMSGIMVVGKVISGLANDFFGRSNMLVFYTMMCGVVCLAVWLNAESVGVLWGFVVLFGLTGGGYVVSVSSVIAEAVGLDMIESANGWLFFAWLFGGLLGQPVSAVIIDHDHGSYKGAIIFAGVLFIVSGLAAVVLRFMRSGPKLFVKI
ncbi:major facilitator superfamily domain-containing protein [Chlamydoabsidia padenii]|nr:major facilitator superfamily domain-containing protein [Chlamydoabsidia padenii]